MLDRRSWHKILVDGQSPSPRLDHSMCVAHLDKSEITTGILLYALIYIINNFIISFR